VKTSGGKGLHVVVHLKPKYGWDVIKPFTKSVAEAIAAFNPKKLLTKSTKAKRTGKIYIDWMRNGRGATCIAPWALRARPGATVSMPVTWEQLPEIVSAGFTIHEPPETPAEWMQLKPETLSKAVLREFGQTPG
jgi:bifunctional non-homologous end joining protein LigD